jgi:hypothetical protein
MDNAGNGSRASNWGWGILITLSVLVALNGVGWFFIGPGLSTFEQDTGVLLAEFERAYPTVAELLSLQARNTAILLAGFGMLAMAVALAGRSGGPGWPRWASWAFVATLASVGLSELVAGAIFGLFYLALAVVAMVGQVLARRGMTS